MAEREWRVVIRRPGVEGEGVSYVGRSDGDEPIARRFFEADMAAYGKDEPSATVALQSRIVEPWEDVAT